MNFLLDHNLPLVWAPVLDLLTEKQWGQLWQASLKEVGL
jgi:hypothetical protein